MIKIKNVRKLLHEVKGNNVEVVNSNVDGAFILLTGKNAKVVLKNCHGKIAVDAIRKSIIYCDKNSEISVDVAPFSEEVVVWNAKACKNATPYFSKWFRG